MIKYYYHHMEVCDAKDIPTTATATETGIETEREGTTRKQKLRRQLGFEPRLSYNQGLDPKASMLPLHHQRLADACCWPQIGPLYTIVLSAFFGHSALKRNACETPTTSCMSWTLDRIAFA